MERDELESKLVETLMEGETSEDDVKEAARRKLPMKTEIRITNNTSPVQEETKLFRQMAKEVDDRYKKYMEE